MRQKNKNEKVSARLGELASQRLNDLTLEYRTDRTDVMERSIVEQYERGVEVKELKRLLKSLIPNLEKVEIQGEKDGIPWDYRKKVALEPEGLEYEE